MSKDPAFLFYYQDFAWGTRKMTFEEKGCYIELLCEQADSGHLSLADIKRILNDSFSIWDSICNKFRKDEEGLFFNVILDDHIKKRKKYTESRKKNLMGSHKETHMKAHMENVNENEDEKLIKEAKKNVSCETGFDQLESFNDFFKNYPNQVSRSKALAAWCEIVISQDIALCVQKALKNYKQHLKLEDWKKPQEAHNWLASWPDWENFKDLVPSKIESKPSKECTGCGGTGKLPITGYKCWCWS